MKSAVIFRSLIAILLIAVYGHSLTNGFVTFDDDILVFNNPAVTHFTIANVFYVFTHFDPELYIPFTFLIYQVEWFMGGGSALPFHIVSLTLHIANALLVMELIMLLTKKQWMAFFFALLFSIHPLNVEAISWISAQKDLLSSMFFLVSIIVFLHYAPLPHPASIHPPKADTRHDTWGEGRKLYVLSIATFTLGLLSKVSIILLPLILVLIDVYRGRTIDRTAIIEKIPYFLLSLLFGIVALFGKHDVITGAGPLTYILIGAKGIMLSLLHFFRPVHLSVLYPYTKPVTFASSDLTTALFTCIALLAIAVLAARRNKTILLGFGFFVLTFAPTFSNIVKAGDLYVTSDRYMYLPMIGILIICGQEWPRWIKNKLHIESAHSWAQNLCTGLILLALSFISYHQSLVWKNTQTLFEHVLATSPDSSLAHNKVGSQLFDDGDIDAAEKEFRTSLALKDNPRAHYNLGLVFLERNDFANALIQNQKAILLLPTYAPAHVNLGYILWKQGNLAEAKKHFQIAIENEIDAGDARANLALIELSESQNAKP